MYETDVKNILSPYFTASKYFDDMVPDFMTMVAERLMTFGHLIDESYKEQLKKEIKSMVIHSRTPVLENRMYIISNVENILFASYSVSDGEIQSLKNTLMMSGSQMHMPDFLKLPPEVVITLYIFHKNDEPYRMNILPTELIYIFDKYKRRNVINVFDI